MKKISNLFWIIIGVAGVCYFIFLVGKRFLTDRIPKGDILYTKAVIINDKNFEPNQPVKPHFTYSYMFKVDGKVYTGNSQDESLKFGDTVEIEYNKNNPLLNKPLHPKE